MKKSLNFTILTLGMMALVMLLQTNVSEADAQIFCSINSLNSDLINADTNNTSLKELGDAWFDICLKPEFESSTSSFQNAINSHISVGLIYLDWIESMQLFGITDQVSEKITEGNTFLEKGFKVGIKGYHESCTSQNYLQQMNEGFLWNVLSEQTFSSLIDFEQNKIDISSFVKNACVQVNLLDIKLPKTIAEGETIHPIFKIGIKIGKDTATIFGDPVFMETTINVLGGSIFSGDTGSTDPSGFWQPEITMPNGADTIVVTIEGTWIEWVDFFPPGGLIEEVTKSVSFKIQAEPDSCPGAVSPNPSFLVVSTCDVVDPLPNMNNRCLTDTFHDRYEGGFHNALDVKAVEGTSVMAVHDGTVDASRYGYDSEDGWFLWITGPSGDDATKYSHLQEAPMVAPGEIVVAGQQIGKTGSTGNRADAPHLEIEYEVDGILVNPEAILNPPSECEDESGENDNAESASITFVEISGSVDPNEKSGPQGSGSEGYIFGNQPFVYTVFFENFANATASALDIVVTDDLDSDLDWSTFEHLDSSHPGVLSVNFNQFTGRITWTFSNINLPPNQNPPEGDGWMIFKVEPDADLPSGTEIRNKASIFFDFNPPIETNEVLNTIDITKPTSNIVSLPQTSFSSNFQINWTGNDAHSGIKHYSIFVSENNGPFTVWLPDINQTSSVYPGKLDTEYSFYSIATDNVGNVEDKSLLSPDASTTTLSVIVCLAPVPGTTWILDSNCSVINHVNVNSNILIQNNAVVSIEDGGSITITLSNKKIDIKSGSGLLIKTGGKLVIP